MSTERFNFNAKPGEPGFREIGKNQYGHTVLQPNKEASDLNDKVAFSIDEETGIPRADLSIWDTQQMKDLAQKLNMPLDQQVNEELPVPIISVEVTDQDMDDLLKGIEDDFKSSEPHIVMASVPVLSISNQDSSPLDNRVRKVSKNSFENECTPESTKLCTDPDCTAVLPDGAKFCSSCGKLQKINLFCIECGRKFNEREKFCADCGCPRE